MDDLYPAQLDGIALEIETLDDSFEKAIARHEFPGRDGALLEDLGQKARSVNIRCYFWDQGEHQTYADHFTLINHLKATALNELIHPQYGAIKGMVERLSVRHEDLDTAIIEITFVENGRTDIAPLEYEDVAAAVEEAFLLGEVEQLTELKNDLAAQLGRFFVAAGKQGRELVAALDSRIAVFDATVGGVTNPINSLIASISYGTDLPGRLLGSITRAVERVSLLAVTTITAPAQLLANLNSSFLQLEQALLAAEPSNSAPSLTANAVTAKHLRIAVSRRLALETATVYRSDETGRSELRRTEAGSSFDISGRYIGTPASGEVMTVEELETTLAAARASLQSGIELARNMTSLRPMARSLLEHVQTVKLERDRLLSVTLDNPLPLHLLCHIHGLDYNMAERIIALNRINNPNFTSGTVQLYGR